MDKINWVPSKDPDYFGGLKKINEKLAADKNKDEIPFKTPKIQD